jgi:chemotaxis family two-component system response regulator Rcp1
LKPSPFHKTLEILFVEDSWGDVLLLREAFRESELPVSLNIVTDGEDALAYLNRDSKYAGAPAPDLVLLDLNLPRMDGRALLRRIKNHPRLKILPVIILTSSTLESDIREVNELNVNSYLVKPTDLKGFNVIARNLWDFWLKSMS